MTPVHYFYIFFLSSDADWQRKTNLPQQLSRRVLDLKNEVTQGIKCTGKSQTVFAFENITAFSLIACSFENGFLNNTKDNKEAGDKL